jgi:hypothetical protein
VGDDRWCDDSNADGYGYGNNCTDSDANTDSYAYSNNPNADPDRNVNLNSDTNTAHYIWHYLLLHESGPWPSAKCNAHLNWQSDRFDAVRRLR